MNLFENVKSGVSAAVETISDVAQNLIEKNRVNAKINRLKLVIKNESSVLNKAYIQLGKYYYENSDNLSKEETENLFEIISNSKARLKRAQDIYRSIIQKQTEEAAAENDTAAEPFVDTITVACSNEDDYTAEESVQTSAQTADEISEPDPADIAEETAEDISEQASDEFLDEIEISQESSVEADDDDEEAF